MRFGESGHDGVRIPVSCQQEQLKEYKAGIPNSRGAAKPWQELLGNYQLHLEKEKGAQKNCQGECGLRACDGAARNRYIECSFLRIHDQLILTGTWRHLGDPVKGLNRRSWNQVHSDKLAASP